MFLQKHPPFNQMDIAHLTFMLAALIQFSKAVNQGITSIGELQQQLTG